MNMTILKNAKAVLKNTNEPVPYAVILLSLLDKPLEEGITVNEMRKSLKLIEKFDTAVKESLEEISLEPEEIEKIKKIVENAQWRIIDNAIVEFSDYISTLN